MDASSDVNIDAVSDAGSPLPATAHDSCRQDTVTAAVPPQFAQSGLFNRYYALEMNGMRPMQFLFQDSLTQAQIERVVRITRWYLTDVPGSQYGADKAPVIARLAATNGTMVVPNGSHVEGVDLGVRGQELYANEIAAEGSAWYLANDPEHRDASLEEIFHQVHDNGIGTNTPGALPEYQAALLAEANRAIADGRWGAGQTERLAELAREGSLAQEYIASVIDNWYGMWAHSSRGSGYYVPNSRATVRTEDPAGEALLHAFLGDIREYEAYVDPTFTGTFHLALDTTAAPYSHKSQYLRGARLTGTNPSSILGNELDNTLRGNSADNTLNGGAGNDTAVYCGMSTDYVVTREGENVVVTGPDGRDVLIDVESLHFADGAQPVPAM